MPRVIFPPFQHKSGSTELEHALDARKLDEAFSELAGVLNGGVDESNLSAGVKFSTVTPGGVSVGTALATKYAIVTLSYSGMERTNTRVPVSVVMGSNWVPYRFSALLSKPSYVLTVSSFSLDAGIFGTGTSLVTTFDSTVRRDGSATFYDLSGALNSVSLTAGHTITVSDNTAFFIEGLSLSFKVPVL